MTSPVQSVARAMRILKIAAGAPTAVGVRELARDAGLKVPVVHGLIKTPWPRGIFAKRRRRADTPWGPSVFLWPARASAPALATLIAVTMCVAAAWGATSTGASSPGGESFETAPVRPEGGRYVPPPFVPVATQAAAAACGNRGYDLGGAIPLPEVAGKPLLERAELLLDGKALAPPALQWTLKTPAVAVAQRTWSADSLRLELKQTIEYDGFVTCDLTLAPAGDKAAVRELLVRLVFRPQASVLYHIPSTRRTPAGLWPDRAEFSESFAGVWGGNDTAGLACYVATFRDWHSGDGPRLVVSREAGGPGEILLRIVAEPVELAGPVTYRLGFIATPVREPEKRHWQLFSLPSNSDDLQRFVGRNLFWSQLSDRYATFSTNDPKGDPDKAALVQEVHQRGKAALAYTTYAHVEERAVDTPHDWLMITARNRKVSLSIGGAMADRNRIYCCPGSRAWIEWKIEDLRAAVERYGVDGFYVDTSYVIMACANREHGHGWLDAAGALQADYPVWSVREIWRRAYELLCRKHGKAEIYAHHKAGCPPALAAFTTAFCDGEQYASQSIKNLTLDAFRAQISGRNVGPLALFLCEYYRSRAMGSRGQFEHHNPTESVMLPLVHDVLPIGYPGNHPVRELLALSEHLGIADAQWTPYYAAGNPWKAGGASEPVVSSYRTARGDTLLVVGNPTYTDAAFCLSGPAEATHARTFVAIDVLSRVGRRSVSTAGYRWEPADPARLSVPARSLRVYAWIGQPESLAGFAEQRGFAGSPAEHARRAAVPADATLLDNFEDPEWTLASDEGSVTTTDREPVDTRRALRVLPKPKQDSAALMRSFDVPQDWSACRGMSFWIRPDRDMPVWAMEPRLRDHERYGPSLTLVSHNRTDVLPAGRWTQLKYEFHKATRTQVLILRIYFNRGKLLSGPFDLDELLLYGGAPKEAAVEAKSPGKSKSRPTPVDQPDAPPE